MGAFVDLFFTRPKSKLSKICFMFNLSIYETIREKHFKKIINRIYEKYDYVLILRADLVPLEYLERLRKKYPESMFIQYIWDDINFYPNLIDTFKYFNRILSYDLSDCKKYGLIFRPFFFSDVLKENTLSSNYSFSYDLFFIGSYTPDRLKILELIKELNPNISFYIYLYINPITFLLNKSIWRKRNVFKFKKLKYSEMISVIKNSRAILDIAHINQRGLSTRVFEALGAKSKIVTTNKSIIDYDFYNQHNILLIDPNKPVIPNIFLESAYEDYDIKILKNYYIKKWILDVFDIKVISDNQ
ncbi:MAG: hypothetical protein KA114_07675 [Bacteroidales bacterium]|nr:hypothetical protein [Bacteroidales bacterium]